MKSVAFISHPDCILHDLSGNHPESSLRLQAITHELISSGIDSLLQHYSAPAVTREQLLRVHDPDYVDTIFAIAPKSGQVNLDIETAMNPYTLSAALHAAGAAVMAVDLVMAHEANAAFCNVRPPGHHAERDRAMGFCIFNNIAIGVAHALEHYRLKRVAIIDFDVHHGNGTEDIFRNNPRVLFCSSFQHPFYPFSGADVNSSHIINIPLPAGTGSREFRAEVIFHWLEAIKKFKPEMIFISAGFDGYYGDTMANLELNETDYTWITQQMQQLADECCKGRIVSVLEGGYDLNSLGRCVTAHIKALLE